MLTAGSTIGDAMHEGAKIKELLAARGLNRGHLGRAVGKSWPAADKWIRAAEIKPGAWATCRRALLGVGIDPAEVRPDENAHVSPPSIGDELDQFSDDQLARIRRLLQTPNLHPVALAYISGRFRERGVRAGALRSIDGEGSHKKK